MKWFYAISLLVVAALVLSPLVLLREQSVDIPAGKVVLWDTYGAAVKSIDPATCSDTTSSSIQANFYEGLYAYHFLIRPPKVVPQLAAEMPEISEDGLTYTIKLKKGVKFQRNPCFGKRVTVNGRNVWPTRELKAKDFELAFKRVADYHLQTGLSWAFLSDRVEGLDDYRQKTRLYKSGDFSRYDLNVSGVKALDDYTLQIKLTRQFPQFIYVLAMHVYAPVPREAVDYWLAGLDRDEDPIEIADRVTEFRRPEMVVGTGPYLLAEWEEKNKIILRRNPLFRDEYYPTEGEPADDEYIGDKAAGLLDDATSNNGKPAKVPFVDVIHYRFVAESYSSWMMFLTKRKDASGIPQETFDSVITPGKDLTDMWEKRGIYLRKYSQPVIYWLVFNMEDRVLSKSKALRQAISLAYDVETHIRVLYNGRGKVARNIIPSSIEGSKVARPGPYYKLDVDLAKKKIQQAKKDLKAAGLLTPDGEIPPLTLQMGDQSATANRTADFAKSQFRKIGLTLKVEFNDWPTLQRKVHNKQAQIYTMGWHADYPDAENFLQLFYTPNIKKGTNNANYSNPEFDRLYEKARVMPPSPERTKLYAKMANMISEDVPVLLLSEPQSFVLFYEWVHNVKPHPIGYGFLKYRRIDAEQRKKLGGGR